MKIDEKQLALIKIWKYMMKGLRDYAESNDFMHVYGLPSIMSTAGACENVNALFELKDSEELFGQKLFLVQSLQLLLEMYTPHYGKVYTEIKSFRNEKEVDDRHLLDFPLFEIEHLGDLSELISHLTGLLKGASSEVALNCQPELKLLGRNWADLLDLKIKQIKYEDAIKLLSDNGFPDLVFGDDLKHDHELKVVELLDADCVFITHYERESKFWNMRDSDIDPRVVNSCDMILRKSGESAGASERETLYERLKKKLFSAPMFKILRAMGVPESAFDWYLNHHLEYDVELHSGAGVGCSRLAQFITGQDSILDATPFPVNKNNII